jgi:hypothetical protein
VRVGVHDNFFDLGGHSIALVEVYSKLKEFEKIEFGLIDMFRHPTVAALAELINKGEEAAEKLSQDRAAQRRVSARRQRELRKRHRTAREFEGK